MEAGAKLRGAFDARGLGRRFSDHSNPLMISNDL